VDLDAPVCHRARCGFRPQPVFLSGFSWRGGAAICKGSREEARNDLVSSSPGLDLHCPSPPSGIGDGTAGECRTFQRKDHMKEMIIPKAAKTTFALEDMVDTILKSLDDDKAQDVLAIDLVGKTSIADRMIIASGTSGRMVSAMAEHLMTKLKALGFKPKSEGERHGDWVLIDAGDVVVHLFRPEVRTFYNIERIWAAPATEKPPAATAAKKAPRKTARRA
jgi:ribosome-associated protein